MRMRFFLVLFLPWMTAVSVPAQGPDGPPRRGGPPPEVVERFDRDGDGVLNEEERAALRAEFGARPPGGPGGPGRGPGGGPGGARETILVPRFDLDGDGVLNDVERGKAREYAKANPAGRGGGRRPGGRGPGGRPRGPGGPGGEAPQSATEGEAVSPEDIEHFPEAELYDPTVVRTLFLEFEQEDWESELADFYRTDVDVPARLTVDGVTFDHPVGVAFRGNSSFFSVPSGSKRSLNLSIDAFEGGQDLKGYNTLNLLNAHADPSFLREALFSHVASRYLPIYRVNFVKLVINGESWGIYVNAQQFNKDFLEEHYGTRKGVRWKVPAGPNGGFRYQGDDPAAYQGGYQLKTASAGDEGWERLIALCKALADATPENAIETLSPVLDLDEALWFLAVDNVFQDGDGYLSRASDYVFYEDPAHRFHVLPYDSNETFRPAGGGGPGLGRGGRRGSGFPGGPPADRPPGGDPSSRARPGGERAPRDRPPGERRQGPEGAGNRPPAGGEAEPYGRPPLQGADDERLPLARALLSVPALRARYLHHVQVLIEDWLAWEKVEPIAATYRDLIREEVGKDTKKLYPTEAFEKSLTEEVSAGRRPLPPLRTFVEERGRFLKEHPDLQLRSPGVEGVTVGPAVAGESIQLSAEVQSDSACEATLHYRAGGSGAFTALPMSREGATIAAQVPGQAPGMQVEYYLEVRGADGAAATLHPRLGERTPARFRVELARSAESPVRLNELMARNVGTVADPQGDHDDWIELHNLGDDVIELAGYSLSDNLDDLGKWRFPEGATIAPGGFLLVWADEDGRKKKGLHANFKLAQSGETVVLSNPEGEVIDFVTFGALADDQAYVRGESGWSVGSATPAASNARDGQ